MRKLIERWSLRIRLIFVLLKLSSSYTNEHDTSPFGLHLREERRQEHHLTKEKFPEETKTSAEILDKMAAALAHFAHNGVQII